MYFCASCKISSRRHVQSDTLEIRVPFSLVNGSGSMELEVKEPGRETGQPAPLSSTPPAATAALDVTVTAPATTSANSAVMRIAERITDRPEVIMTRTLLPG
jgi:hypothetical protein